VKSSIGDSLYRADRPDQAAVKDGRGRLPGKEAEREAMSEGRSPITRGGGNVFADLPLEKDRLVAALEAAAKREKLNRTEISRRSGITQPRISRILSGIRRSKIVRFRCSRLRRFAEFLR
jgi:hypothetical protein